MTKNSEITKNATCDNNMLENRLLKHEKMDIKEVTETEMFEILEKNIKGVFYYINHLGRYYCYLITETKKTSNIWNHKKFAFNWMNNVLQTHFTQTTS